MDRTFLTTMGALRVTADDIDAMVEAFDQVAKAPRDMKVRRIEAAAFALRNRYCERLDELLNATRAPICDREEWTARVLEARTRLAHVQGGES